MGQQTFSVKIPPLLLPLLSERSTGTRHMEVQPARGAPNSQRLLPLVLVPGGKIRRYGPYRLTTNGMR